MTRSILVIGAGFGQLPAIATARRMGLRVIGVDVDPSAPGMALCDVSEVVDVKDGPGVLRVAERERIDGVLTMQSDLPVPTVGFVNERLGLTGVNQAVANACSAKHLMRRRLRDAGVPQPDFDEVRTAGACVEAVRRIGFPSIVKAADSSGSRGVVRVDAEEDIAAAFGEARKYSRSGVVVVEAFVDGIEMGAQTFSVGGECRLVLPHNDTVATNGSFVPTGHSYPFESADVDLPPVLEGIARAIVALGIEDGPANVDLIVDPGGVPQIVEIGARIGATCLPELTSHHLDLDWTEMAIRSAMGETVTFGPLDSKPCAALVLEAPSNGVLRGVVVPDWIRTHGNLLELEITARPGDEVSELRKGTDRIGKVFVAGETVREAEALAQRMRDGIEFDVAPG